MNCQEVRERLPALIDGELPPPEQAQVEQHLEGCEDCRAEKHRQEQFTTRVKTSLEDLRPSEMFVKGVLDKLDEPAKKRREDAAAIRRTKVSLICAGAVVLAALLAVLIHSLTREPRVYSAEVTGYTRDKAWLVAGGKGGVLPIPVRLPNDARVKAGEGGKVVMRLTGGGELTLEEKSSLLVSTAAGRSLPSVSSGGITLTAPAGRAVKIKAGQLAVKVTAESRVQVSVQYGGTVVVKVTSGSARIVGAGAKEVEARPGEVWRAPSDGSVRPEKVATEKKP